MSGLTGPRYGNPSAIFVAFDVRDTDSLTRRVFSAIILLRLVRALDEEGSRYVKTVVLS